MLNFQQKSLPEIFEALEIRIEGQPPLVLEVQNHLGNHKVRCVAMDTTEGLQRGIEVVCHRSTNYGSCWRTNAWVGFSMF